MDRTDLSLDSFKVNGVYFEDKVQGYRTLNVSGRELIGRSFTMRESDKNDGVKIVRSRYPQREITVEYFIESADRTSFIASYLTLMELLNQQDAQIIFNDETDKYITGSFQAENDVDESQFSRSGSYKIICADPFKYSVTEYTENAVSNQWSFTYDGTYKAHPRFEISFPNTIDSNGDSTTTSQCGYIGLVSQMGAELQFGDPEATNWADVVHPATVPLNRTFKSVSGWTSNNTGVLSGTQTGTVAANSTDQYIYPSSYGSGSGWHGPSLSKILSETPPVSTNFEFSWKEKFSGTKKQFGACSILLWNNNSGTRTLVCGVEIVKVTKDAKCKVNLYVGSTTAQKSYTVNCSKIGSCSMLKQDKNVTFSVGGKTEAITCDDIETLVANEISFHFTQKDSDTVLGSNFIYNCKLQRFSFPNWEDVPNIFMPGTKLIIDCKNAEVTLDSGDGQVNAQGIGKLGNDWETFLLTTGTNVITLDYSDWTTVPPTGELKYRKVYL